MVQPRRSPPIGRGIKTTVGAPSDNDFLQYDSATGRWAFVTAVEAGLISAQQRMKDADLARSSTTTLAADDDLIGFSFDANSFYLVEMMLLVQSASSTPGFKWDISFSSAPQDSGGGMHAFGGGVFIEQTNGTLGTTYTVSLASSDEYCVMFKGYVLTNASTGGTASFRWAQNVSNATATNLRRGSWIRITKR